MISTLLLDCLFSCLRVILILFPLYLIFEGVTRRFEAQISARVGSSLAIGWIDYLKSLTKSEREKRTDFGLNAFFVLAVAMFSLIPWFPGNVKNEFELRLHLYFFFTILFLAAHFLYLFGAMRDRRQVFPSQEIYLFFMMITVIVLNESSLILLGQSGSKGVWSSFLSVVLTLIQVFVGLTLFYFRSESKEVFESKVMRSRLIFFEFSKFIAGMSWICLHFTFLHPENRISLFGFALSFMLFIALKTVMEGYARLNEKLAGLITWKYFFPASMAIFVIILLGDWIE